MVICCAAANCSNRQGKACRGAVSFHRFPLKDSKRLIQWLKAVQRDNWTPTKYSFLCSEHFTKDSFSKRLEDQHRLLKPTAVPTIFQLVEKKHDKLDYVRSRRKIARQVPVRDGEALREGGGEVAQRAPSSGQDFMVMQGTKEMEEATLKEEMGSMSEEEEALHSQLDGPRRRTLGDHLGAKPGAQTKPERSPVEDCARGSWAGSWVADRSGVSVDDFTPPASGACKFIGSLHSYSFSSKHARERPSLPKEQLERKRPKREVEPSCSSHLLGHDKAVAEVSPTSSLTATPQKPSQGLSASPADLTPRPATEAVVGRKGDTDANPMSINEVIMSASGACKLIDSLHSYCFSSRQSKSQVCCLREQVEKKNGELKLLRQRISRSDSQVRKLKEKLDEMKRNSFPYLNSLISQDCETPQLNPVMEPLSWMLGTWLSDPPGDGTFPTMKPFQYLEEVHISHVGQPMLNFSFNAFHPDTRKPMHRECGFIRLKPDTNKVAFISAQNTGLVEVEEGEVNGQELSIASHSIARISFAKKPHVEQITRKFRLNSDGKLEQTVSMATTTQPMTQHFHITYKKVTP
ncbi:LOW QUALITY PROTEIN: peroxynitrite isomerase THAP4 [Corvus cornix cornix]|uniref:LOW QUALITY PROTEIN: peroxynitrite isomerase THAP4 n=1 Tax=Corvus cornix cornix TaxID=932674 RepID=UPI0019512281|nr:LOW QUALITY PROTEIN: peroxynitrite isomerase THAP4 [Corvus cornix cornix]XP_048170053.1 peroxynitrite isomerase THAP4 isoform X1 [Corvus hawaiiensis]